MKKHPYFYGIGGVILLILIIVLSYHYSNRPKEAEMAIEDAPKEWGTPEVAVESAKQAAETLPATGKQYRNTALHVSFNYPADLTISSIPDESGTTLLVQNAGKSIGLQIYATPFVDPLNTLTAERIETDLGVKVADFSFIKIGTKGNINAATFVSSEGGGAPFREVWFIHKGNIFMAKGYKSSEPLIEAVLKTLVLE